MSNTALPSDFKLPAGYVISKIGGRPTKHARDIAVFLARFMRTKKHGELVKIADQWILDHWLKNSQPQSQNAIHEDAHIRRAIKNASDLLNGHMIFSPFPEVAQTIKLPIVNGADGWIWCEGMVEAHPIKAKDVKATIQQDVMSMKPTAIAARRLFTQIAS